MRRTHATRGPHTRLMKTTLLYLLTSLLVLQPASAADLQLKWSDLAETLRDQDVQLVLPGGGMVRGTAVTVREDALILDVRQTSDRKAYPKGQATIPRTSVSVVNLRRTKGSVGRTVGKTLGVLGGLIVTGEIIGHGGIDSEGAAIAIILGVTTAATVGGHYLGKAMDERLTVIRVVQ